MNLVLTGVNHKSAPLELRERLAIPPGRLREATQSLLSVPCVQEAMILSTCNRVEFLTCQEPARADLLKFLQDYFSVDAAALRPHLYEYRAAEAVRHLFRVASSLDSLVVGEPQILGQVKEAYSIARSADGVRQNLDPLLQRTFTVARKVRSQTSIGMSSVSVASVAVDLAQKIFESLHGKTVLLMGAGKMGELAARSLMHQGAAQILLCNRTDERAVALAEKFSHHAAEMAVGSEVARDVPAVRVIPYGELHEHAALADIVVSSTGSEEPIFHKKDAEMYVQQRKRRPMFFIDIAVPRDVDPEIERVEGIFVYNIDDLQAVAATNRASRDREAQDAESIVRAEVERYAQRVQTLDALPAILELQRMLEEMRQQELHRVAPRLGTLSDEQLQAVEQVTRALVNKMQHSPIQAIKRAAREGDSATLAMIQETFHLSMHDELADTLHAEMAELADVVEDALAEPEPEPEPETVPLKKDRL